MIPFAVTATIVVASVLVGLTCGYYIRYLRGQHHARLVEQERQITLTALVEILQSIERLSTDVGARNSEIREVGKHVGGMRVSGELQEIQKAVVGHISSLLTSNQSLEDDLVVARHQMENQAEEIDRSRREARTDALSGVANRKAFDERLLWLLTTWKRDRAPFVLIMADLDRFKWVNDTHGHQTGDRVLQQMGGLLKQGARRGDFVARYGGDEFALLLPHTKLPVGVQVAAEIRELIFQSTFPVGSVDEEGVISLSLGVTGAQDGDTVEAIISRADKALYKSKEMGRNRVYCHSGEEAQAVPI